MDPASLQPNQRRPVRGGIIWSENVAKFILDIYPDILESDMDMFDLVRIINGKYEL